MKGFNNGKKNIVLFVSQIKSSDVGKRNKIASDFNAFVVEKRLFGNGLITKEFENGIGSSCG